VELTALLKGLKYERNIRRDAKKTVLEGLIGARDWGRKRTERAYDGEQDG